MLIASMNMNVDNGNQDGGVLPDTWPTTPGGHDGHDNSVIASAGLDTGVGHLLLSAVADVQPLQASGLQMLVALFPNAPAIQ